MNAVCAIANYEAVAIKTPYLHCSKIDILAQGLALGAGAVDYAETWTCYNGRAKACGKCGGINGFSKVQHHFMYELRICAIKGAGLLYSS